MIWFVYFYLFFLVYLLLLMVMDYLSFLADMYLLLVSHPILRDPQIQFLLITHPAIYFILIILIHSYTYIHYGLQNNDGWYDKLVGSRACYFCFDLFCFILFLASIASNPHSLLLLLCFTGVDFIMFSFQSLVPYSYFFTDILSLSL